MENNEKVKIVQNLQILIGEVGDLAEKMVKLEQTILPDGDPTKHLLVRIKELEKGVRRIHAIDAQFKKLEAKDDLKHKEAAARRWQLFLSILPGLGALLWLGLKHYP